MSDGGREEKGTLNSVQVIGCVWDHKHSQLDGEMNHNSDAFHKLNIPIEKWESTTYKYILLYEELI